MRFRYAVADATNRPWVAAILGRANHDSRTKEGNNSGALSSALPILNDVEPVRDRIILTHRFTIR